MVQFARRDTFLSLTIKIKFQIVLFVFFFTTSSFGSDFLHFAEEALKVSANLKIAREAVDLAASDKGVAISTYLPQLTGTLKLGATREDYQDSTTDYNDQSAEINLTQDILNISKLYSIKSARQQINLSEAEFQSVYQDMLQEYSNVWLLCWKSQSQFEVASQNVKILKSYLESEKTRYDAGEINITDVRLAETRYQAAVSQKIRFQREQNRANELFREITAKNPPRIINLPVVRIELLQLPGIEDAIEQHPKIKVLNAKQKINKTDIKKNKMEHMPVLQLKAKYMHQIEGEYQDTRYPYDESYVGVELNVPIFSGGRTSNNVEKALIRKKQQTFRLADMKLELKRMIQTAVSDMNQSKEELISADKQVVFSTETLKSMAEEYEAGTRTSVDVFLSQSDMISARLTLIYAKEENSRFLFKYLHALGVLTIDIIKQLNSVKGNNYGG